MIDKFKLGYEIKRNGMTAQKLCDAIGMSRSAYYRKVSGKSEFTRIEIQRIAECLNLVSPMEIFFTQKVS